MKNITLSAEEHLIEQARARAQREQTTLNEEFRRWLAEYARSSERADLALAVVEELREKLRTGGRKWRLPSGALRHWRRRARGHRQQSRQQRDQWTWPQPRRRARPIAEPGFILAN